MSISEEICIFARSNNKIMKTSKDVIQVGDIVYVDSSKNINYCSPTEWEASLGKPIGVVAIPRDFLPDSPEMRIISLFEVGYYKKKEAKIHNGDCWCLESKPDEISSLSYYHFICNELDVEKNAIVKKRGVFLCSDKFNTQLNPYDKGYGWKTVNDLIVPSPYKEDDSFNEQFIDKRYFPIKRKLNPLTDFNGKGNTDILCDLKFYPAANACKEYKAYKGDKLKWYLPSIGELVVYFHDFNKINASIEKVGGLPISRVQVYWSSTQYSSRNALSLHPNIGFMFPAGKQFINLVRPFTKIN